MLSWSLIAAGAGLCLAASVGYAQFRNSYLPIATPKSFDGAFQFCRIAFRGIQGGDGGGWLTDYPDADLNFSTRLGELTKVPISKDARTGEPNHLIVQFTDPLLYRCPFIMGFEVGNFYIDEKEAAALRRYLEKGGFLWVDDFWGNYAWSLWESQIHKALPSGPYPIRDLPLDHTIFHQVFEMSKIPQIPSIDYWLSTRDTSERGSDSRPPHVRVMTTRAAA